MSFIGSFLGCATGWCLCELVGYLRRSRVKRRMVQELTAMATSEYKRLFTAKQQNDRLS
jgi:uncharacterized membrane protein YccC